MPIYEYHCPECDNLFEEWCQRIDDVKSKPCPQCGKTAERIISQTSFALKGDGWYVTEYGTMKDVKEPSSTADATTGDNGSGGQDTSTSTSAEGAGTSPGPNTAGTTSPAASNSAANSKVANSTASAPDSGKATPATSATPTTSASPSASTHPTL